MIDADRLESFLESLDPEESCYLDEVEKEAIREKVPIIRKETQRLLRFLVMYTNPEKILEIGTAIGYSALLMWDASGRRAGITTIENYEKRIGAAKENFMRFDAGEKITLLEGDAAKILPTLKESYPMIFMDAAKGQYLSFLPEVTRLLEEGGLLITDNIWQDGDILESRYAVRRRDRTIHERMRDYLYELTHSEVYDTVLLNIGDGVALSHRKRKS